MNTLKPIIECILNPFLSEVVEAPSFANIDRIKEVEIFHKSLPGYQVTPLLKLGGLAARLGIHTLMIKDESHRFELKAFKVLGASYALSLIHI